MKSLKIESFIKTSGKTGFTHFCPYCQCLPMNRPGAFAEAVGRILLKRHPEKITKEWDTRKRKGRVFLTIIKMPEERQQHQFSLPGRQNLRLCQSLLSGRDLSSIVPTDYTILNVPDILTGSKQNPGKYFKSIWMI